jgi:hypothetical protein
VLLVQCGVVLDEAEFRDRFFWMVVFQRETVEAKIFSFCVVSSLQFLLSGVTFRFQERFGCFFFLHVAVLSALRLVSLNIPISCSLCIEWGPFMMSPFFSKGKVLFPVCMLLIGDPGNDEVRVRMKAVGICGSDVHYLKVRSFTC